MTASTAQTWFITGASSGFGRAFALQALSAGHNVVVTARDPARLAALSAQAPGRVLALALDVDQAGQVEAAAQAALSRFGRIDVLINNAGYGLVGAVEETPDQELRAVMDTNFFGAAAMIRAVLPAMRAQRSGAIVNISSMGGQLSFAGFGAYSASKFALEGLSEALAQEVAPFGIKVLIVEPGAFRTDFAGGALRHMPELEAYRDTSGNTRAFAHGMHGTQEGDPAKAAAAVARALADARTPLRLQLGGDAVDAVRTHAEQLLSDLREWEPLARDTRVSLPA
ncbi:oxidoreductase [Lysobacter sp.]|uniref:oxidoreductase n=1 Tax=Lysobacter sp. TaxID=72226 RepID=UPI002D2829BF|nr:oxidoreductase [Lysobacter sp.]HZX78946.1 oxidoreductase [Lysobacter sp.]